MRENSENKILLYGVNSLVDKEINPYGIARIKVYLHLFLIKQKFATDFFKIIKQLNVNSFVSIHF